MEESTGQSLEARYPFHYGFLEALVGGEGGLVGPTQTAHPDMPIP